MKRKGRPPRDGVRRVSRTYRLSHSIVRRLSKTSGMLDVPQTLVIEKALNRVCLP